MHRVVKPCAYAPIDISMASDADSVQHPTDYALKHRVIRSCASAPTNELSSTTTPKRRCQYFSTFSLLKPRAVSCAEAEIGAVPTPEFIANPTPRNALPAPDCLGSVRNSWKLCLGFWRRGFADDLRSSMLLLRWLVNAIHATTTTTASTATCYCGPQQSTNV